MPSLAAPVLWSAFVVWRAPEWGLLNGAPLTPLAVAACAAVWWLWALGHTFRVAWPVALLIAKIGIGLLLAPHGLEASYFSNASWEGTPEHGLYGAWPRQTRVDDRLSFQTDGPDLPVYFLNDQRFARVGRRQPVSVEWRGYLQIDEGASAIDLYLRGERVTAEVILDGVPVVAITANQPSATAHARTRAGLRRLVVRMSGADGVPDRLEAGTYEPSTGQEHPFDRSRLFRDRVSPARRFADFVLRPFIWCLDVVLLVWLLYLTADRVVRIAAARTTLGWRTVIIRLIAPAACIDALVRAHGSWQGVVLLARGSDRLTYEIYARDILFNGPLMTLGSAPGAGEPFYYQPLYPYFMAVAHLVLGEGLWGIYVLQSLGLALIVYTLWSIADLLFDRATAWACVCLAFWFAYWRMDGYATALYNESLFFPLICAWTLWVCREVARPGSGTLTVGAALGGMGALARSTLAGAFVPAVLLMAWAYRRSGRHRGRLLVLVLLLGAVIGIATTRNFVVARRLVPITISGPINMRLGNPGPPLDLSAADSHPLAQRFITDPNTRAVFESAYHAPGAFAAGFARKGAYALGLEPLFGVTRPAAYRTTIPIHWTLPWIWVFASVGVVLLLKERRPDTTGLAQWVPLAVALTHLAAIVIVFPYSERLVLPFYMLLVVYAAVPLGRAARWAVFRTSPDR